VVVAPLLDDWFEQPLMTATGVASKATVEATCLNMTAAYPAHVGNKLKVCVNAHGFRSHH
jgi:hypothetical protein